MSDRKTLFIEEYQIRGNETDRAGKLSLQGLTNIMQETAGNHAKVLGFSVEELQRKGISWLLYRMQLSIIKWPQYGDIIRIETWPSGIQGIYAFREFEIRDGSEKIGTASTAWLVFNLENRRLIKIPREFGEKIPSSGEGPRILLKKKIEMPGNFEAGNVIQVEWQHLDLNNHTNNVHYYAWMMGSTPEWLHVEKTLFQLDAIFKGETGLGDRIRIETGILGNKMIYKLSLNDSGKDVMISETIWK